MQLKSGMQLGAKIKSGWRTEIRPKLVQLFIYFLRDWMLIYCTNVVNQKSIDMLIRGSDPLCNSNIDSLTYIVSRGANNTPNMAPSATYTEPEPEYIIVHAGKGTIKRQILTGAHKKPTFETIPEVDFTPMNSPSLSDRKALAQQVGAAFRDSGFLYARNHGISEELQANLTRVIKEFFDLPLEEKMKV